MFITNAWAASTEVTQSGATQSEATHSETGTAHGEGGHGGGAFPPFDPTYFASQLLWLAITFGIFYMIMSRVIIPRIAGILEVRRDRITHDLGEAQRLKEESDAAIAAYEQELAEARKRAQMIGQEARDAAKADADARRAEAEAGLSKKLAESERQIADVKARALSEVGTIARDTAGAIVRELIGGNPAPADIAKAIDSVTR